MFYAFLNIKTFLNPDKKAPKLHKTTYLSSKNECLAGLSKFPLVQWHMVPGSGHEEREARPGLETPEGVNARCQGQATTTSAEFLHDSRLRTKQILKGLRIKDQV